MSARFFFGRPFGFPLTPFGKGGIILFSFGFTYNRQQHSELLTHGRPFLLYLLSIAYLKADQPDQGLAIIDDVLYLLEQSNNHFFLAGFYQLKGELLVSEHRVATRIQGSTEEHSSSYIQEAEDCFLEAIKVAQRQNAKSWELKATLSLARLWQQRGKSEGARAMLAAIYDWFTEGFDQPDLIEARAILEAL